MEHASHALAPPGFTPGEPGFGNYSENQIGASSPPGFMPGDDGLKSLAAKWSNQGSTGVKPAGAELCVAACGSRQTRALPAQGRQGPNRNAIRLQPISP